MNLRELYRSLVPYETRYWLYKSRHPAEFERLRTAVNHHPQGDFSIRAFDQLQCIFVHITKSAGTSVAQGLFGELPYHYTASQYRVIFGRRHFNRYFKFAFVRNPWDRLYSAYSYLQCGGWDDHDKAWRDANFEAVSDFDDFVLNWLTPERRFSHVHFWPQQRFLCDRHGRALLDHIGYFETLASDYEYIRQRIGSGAPLPHTNRSVRISYRDAFTPAAIKKVGELYANDIQLLGYQFDDFQRRVLRNGILVST